MQANGDGLPVELIGPRLYTDVEDGLIHTYGFHNRNHWFPLLPHLNECTCIESGYCPHARIVPSALHGR
jgi:hypothetical protein